MAGPKGKKGKKGKSFGKKLRMRDDPENVFKKPMTRAADIERENKDFEAYYKAQNIIPSEEWESFMDHFRRNLPTAFRVTGTREQAEDIVRQINRDYIPYIENLEVEGSNITPPQPIPWYPNGLGWTFDVPKVTLKKSTLLNNFHKFLVTESEIGNISRQEAVSMIPPLLLDVQPHHAVLDMCAAPGSKTAQIVEMLHDKCPSGTIPEGVVIANDSNYKRACLLVHQTNRLQSPCLIVTNHNGERFPNLYLYKERTLKPEYVKFDRILADVPCSGDGTLRKNPVIWENWRIKEAVHLHKIQDKILKRSIHLLKPGGRIVYSTCSLNPIENEAVLAETLNYFGDSLELVDVSSELPGLIKRPGLSTWKVFDYDGNLVDKPNADAPPNSDEKVKSPLPASLFPPENAESLHLDRCLRIYPHLQNTGGFFVSVLQKVKQTPLPAENVASPLEDIKEEGVGSENDTEEKALIVNQTQKKLSDENPDSTPADQNGDTKDSNKRIKREDEALPTGKSHHVPLRDTEYLPHKPRIDPELNENPFIFLNPSEGSLQRVMEYYGLSKDILSGGFLVRADKDIHRTVYFVSHSVKTLLDNSKNRLRMVNTGIKLFAKPASRDPGCEFRLVSEGVLTLIPFIGKRFIIDMGFEDFKQFLIMKNPRFEEFSKELCNLLKATDKQTSLIVRYSPDVNESNDLPGNSLIKSPIVLPVWRGNDSISIHIDKHELRSIIIRVLGVEADKGIAIGNMENNLRTGENSAKDKRENE